FGGCGVVCPMGDTWIYSAPGFGTGTWTQIFSPVAPPARYFATLSYVPQARQLVLFGGCEGSVGPCPAGDTWLFSGSGTWKHDPLSLTGNLPPPRFGAAATSIPNEGTILFGGMGVGGPLQDTWNYSLFQPSVSAPGSTVLGWHLVNTQTTPPPRVFGSLAFDRVENWLVLFGGCEPSRCPAQDPWIFNITQPRPPPGGGSPPTNPWKAMPIIQTTTSVTWNATLAPEYGVAAFWDPIESSEGYIVAFGGRGITGGTHGGTFSFVGDYWYDLSSYV
ncbi:MAG: hypothetical protein L3J97_01795, partial [Thermoplasmata archaeon]|nr:hypothetical protein [Thermoplasmata archaeon]